MNRAFRALTLGATLLAVSQTGQAGTPPVPDAAQDAARDADSRARALVQQMTLDEKIGTVFGHYGTLNAKTNPSPPGNAIPYSAGFVYGVPRLGIPDQLETDAGIGVATHRTSPTPRPRTALPSGLATAATWDEELAFKGGAMIGNEARLSGFNVMLAGGVNLTRDPRNGRNFEYGGEDPLLAGRMVGQQIRGIQSNHIVSTIKHFAFNDQETERFTASATLGEAAGRQSDLLAFEIAMETGSPGSVMCAYNRVGGTSACENEVLLNQILKGDWGFKGYVMSDWGAVHSTGAAALNGLDQESAGASFDTQSFFEAPLKAAVEKGAVPQARLDDMVRRILRTLIDKGVFEHPVNGDQSAQIDIPAHAAISQADAEAAIVLLKNNGVLPLARSARRVLVIGGHADVGVLSGGGSSQVYPVGGAAIRGGPDHFPGPMVYYPSAPLEALKHRLGGQVSYLDGQDRAEAVRAAHGADVVIVFATQWTGESLDAPSLRLPEHQDDLIKAVAKANSRTIVVLETGGPVTMPWVKAAAAVVEAWYPGTSGGEAIARVLTGEVNPSGHLPVTFPASEAQLPRPVIDGDAVTPRRVEINYDREGAAIGYKWFDKTAQTPLFSFGHGLSYSRFATSGLTASPDNGRVRVSFRISNIGPMTGKAVAQLYVSGPKGLWEAPKRLGGWAKVQLAPGETAEASVEIDPKLLAVYDTARHQWRIAEGDYVIHLGQSSDKLDAHVTVHLPAQVVPVAPLN